MNRKLIEQNKSFIQKELELRQKGHLLRNLREVKPLTGAMVEVDGKILINFSSNDYLGLAQNEQLSQRAVEFIHTYGAGSTASRLVCGSLPFFAEIERKLAQLKGTQSALILNSGYQANVSLFPALTNRDSLILADRLCHNSIVSGAILSRCKLVRFRHNDLSHLQQLLDQHAKRYSRVVIVTETVFSMDGDCCDVDEFAAIAAQYGALTIVDEAHATGVLGPKGMGLACGSDIDIVMGTFGKGCGSFGAYIACSDQIKSYLVNYCSGFIYTTALPPSVLGSISAALDIVPSLDKERRHLFDMVEFLRHSLNTLGFKTGKSSTQIIPVIIGDDQKTVSLGHWLEKNGILAVSIRPPTVEQGQARIRLALSALHTKQQLETLINAFKTWTP